MFKASGITPTQAGRIYGFDSMCQSASKVEKAIHDAQNTREVYQPSRIKPFWCNLDKLNGKVAAPVKMNLSMKVVHKIRMIISLMNLIPTNHLLKEVLIYLQII